MSKEKVSAEVQKLFQTYDKATANVESAKAALDTAMAERSLIVKTIVDKSGLKAFRHNGVVLKLMIRGGKTQKTDAGGNKVVNSKGKPVWVPNGEPETYFFRGEGATSAPSTS